jgi:hypothetical protein
MGIFEPVRQRDGTGSREEARDDHRRLAGATIGKITAQAQRRTRQADRALPWNWRGRGL